MSIAPAPPVFPDLPEDNYGVHVDGDMDAKRLQYLVAQVGEAKVRKSAEKSKFKPIFVSTLLKRFQIRVPTHIYARINIPSHRVYVLAVPAEAKFKVGQSGYWTQRAYAFSRGKPEELDLGRSVGISFSGERAIALAAEQAVLSEFSAYKVPPPNYVAYGSGGHKEWLSLDAYDAVIDQIRAFEADQPRPILTLRDALLFDSLLWSNDTNLPIRPTSIPKGS